ncbi:related to glutathione-S-transferase [Sporisorium reilianum f. sp. reilianum]|uniref:Related to glutathione-S-transferase n=1 Tax=Sporisorium reilianum f. sp. reilianum TaxID=72559 RepID=A0A2N8UAZ6_9BASI|nr:related to glutathione-S-transferase [Sporisorium reilianum f. sp. reilianum]
MSKPAPGHKDAVYHTECTGYALETVKAHSSPSEQTLFGACFCPFVHRVWIALEYLEAPYQYREVDPYKKPADLLELNPKGLVPALKLVNGKGLSESTVILEYIDEKYGGASGKSLLPPLSDPYERALYRLAVDKTNRNLIPSFYRYLQAQEVEAQLEGAKEFTAHLSDFVRTMSTSPTSAGFWDGQSLSIVDCTVAPWLYRATNVLRHFRGFDPQQLLEADVFERWSKWTQAVFGLDAFKATTSTDELYLDSYVRYAQNRPMTSQVADAINKGRGLP